MARSFLHGHFLAGPGGEVARVDGVEARFLNAEKFEAPLHRDDLGRGLRPHVAVRMQSQLADPGLLDPADAGDECEPVSEASTVSLDVDDESTPEHGTAEFGDRTHE